MWLAYAMVWISVSFATCFGIYITKSPWCLWAFVLPMFIKLVQGNGSNTDTEIDDKEEN